MSTLQWSIGSDLPHEHVDAISERVFEHGRSLAHDGNATPLACLVRDGNELVAGASGRTEYARLFVASLWVHERLRSAGIGTELLRRMEHAARAVGCDSALIETLSDRACSLYLRVGYKVIAQVPRYVGPFNRYILVKPLAPSAA